MTTTLSTSLFPSDYCRLDENANVDLWSRIQSIAEQNGDNLAVIDDETQLSYTQLLNRVEIFLGQLKELNIQPWTVSSSDQLNTRPAIIVMRNSWQQVVAMLAMIKIGQVFICLDPQMNSKQIESVLLKTDAVMTVHDESCAELSNNALATLNTNTIDWQCAAAATQASPNQMVCQILTSGSTGTPKTISYTQEMIWRDIAVRSNCLGFAQSDRFAQLLNGTSLPIMTLFLALLNGAQLVLGRPYNGTNIDSFVDWLERHGITILRLTPTLLRLLCRNLNKTENITEKIQSIRLFSTGGEALYKEDVDQFNKAFGSHAVLINHLAATEFRVACHYLIYSDTVISDRRVPVGKALPGITLCIVDENNTPVQQGETGRIAISSPTISPQLPSISIATSGAPNDDNTNGYRSAYLSEDLGFIDSTGNLIHVGRIGQERKINGARVNLAEIDSILTQIEGVQSATTFDSVDISNDTESRLITAIHYIGSSPPKLSDLRKLIYSSLNFFGLPNKLILVNEPTKTNNGKLDRRALANQLSAELTSNV